MREALAARPDRDFVLAASPRRGRAKVAPRESYRRRALSFALRHPLELAVSLVLLGAGSAIAWNALALQTARHPAPLFAGRGKAGEAPPAASSIRPIVVQPSPLDMGVAPAPEHAAPVPLPPRPVARDSIGNLIRTGEPPSASRPAPVLPPARPAPAPATVTTPQKPSAMRDPIGDLIRLGVPAPIPPGLVGRPESAGVVNAGQRALARLGYGVTVDGIMGPGTRQAIEQFERDRRLPVTGEFSPHTARALSAESGVPVE